MSLTKKCDFCGKLEGVVRFTESPFVLILQNHSGDNYEVKANLVIQRKDDADCIKDFNNNKNGMAQNLVAQALFGGMDPSTKVSELIKIKNPDPHVCDTCRKILIKYVSNYCKPGKVEVF